MFKIIGKVFLIPFLFLSWCKKRLPPLIFISLFIGLIGFGTIGFLYFYFIVKHPGDEFSRESIMEILSRETPVYYDDGKNLIGVFFKDEHRIYIKYEEIPKDFVNALIAAEDKNFFRHPGIDLFSILRATWVNIKSGKIIQGGSTLTQQTAKNLFKREGRTFRAKIEELIQALKLEAHFSKEEIIEFFVNQFYVTGTGRGLAVAAKYFFDKPVNELNLLECAFIAGAVRAPNRYNPLVQPNPEKKKVVFARAVARKNYVLKNMFKLGMISPTQYYQLLEAPIPFKEGKVYYELNVILDYLKEELQSEKFQNILNDHGISNIATSGIKIYTFINYELQQSTQKTLRKHLSQLETMLTGYNRTSIQSRYASLTFPEVNEPKIGQFVLGRVETKENKGREIGIGVRLGGVSGKIDLRGLQDIISAYAKYRKGPGAEATSQDIDELLSQIEVGDLVYVYVREKSPEGIFLLDLEQKPKLEGGVLVSQQGKILAMVGGFENSYFNRAIDAKRQMGSIFKPLVYTAALQLGWNILDPLENQRDVFIFQNQFYFPRPDHESPYNRVSLAWAGVKSENLASVWLLYHLCDKLSLFQFKQIAELVDLSPRENEDYYTFQKRLRDSWGITVTEDDLREAAFQMAKEELITDLIFEGNAQEAEALRFLKYGTGFDNYRTYLLNSEEGEDELEKSIQLNILKEHLLRYLQLNQEMKNQWEGLKSNLPDSWENLSRFYLGVIDGKEIIAYGENLIDKGFIPLVYEKAINFFSNNFSVQDVWIEGKIRSSTLTNLEDLMEKELIKLNANRPYDLITLWRVRDYRVLVGLLYVVKLCETLGINSPLEPVLSFPLGPSAVSLMEILQAYTAFTDGKQYCVQNGLPLENGVIIDRIEDAEGKEIYHYQPEEKLVIDRNTTLMISQVLKNVVNYGTGSKAKDSVTLRLNFDNKKLVFNIPTLGKTGTANEYSNSSYIGFVPGFSTQNELSLANSFVIAAYVGYDDNTPMKSKNFRIVGASGALPIWIDVANFITKNQLFLRYIDPIDFAFLSDSNLPLPPPPGAIPVPVDPGNGLPIPSGNQEENWGEETAIVYSYGQIENGIFKPQRFFSPFKTERLTTKSPWLGE